MTLVVTHTTVTGAAADSTALVDGPAWDANHTLTGVAGLSQGGTAADLSATGGTGQVLKQASAGAAVTVGTVAASEVASGAALTRTNDTNVTLTLGGAPTTALLAATSITVGWASTLAETRGGTGKASYAVGDLLYADTTTTLAKLADIATGNALISGGVGVAPSWGKIGISTHISGFGTGVATALGVNVGTAGSPVVNGGALGTPASGTLTSCTAFTLTTTGTSGAATYSAGTLNVPQYTGFTGTITPQGRITLTSGTSVMATSVSGATTVYYTPAVGNLVPLYDGANFNPTVFPEVSQTTSDTTKSPLAVAALTCYDLFGWDDSGTKRVTRGPAWLTSATVTITIATPGVITWTGHNIYSGAPVIFTTTGALPTGITASTIYYANVINANTFNIATTMANLVAGTYVATSGSQSGVQTASNSTTARASGGGLTIVNGIPLNTTLITNGPAASRGTWLGTICSNASSTIDYIFGGAGANGVAAVFNVWNAYNRVPVSTTVNDTTASWTYSTNAFRAANGSATSRVTFVRGAATDGILSFFSTTYQPSATTASGQVTIGLNSTTASSGVNSFLSGGASTTTLSVTVTYAGTPGIGQSYVAGLEFFSGTGSITFYGQTSLYSSLVAYITA